MKTDTPETRETDGRAFRFNEAHLNMKSGDYEIVMAEYARKLERERDQLREAVKALLKDHNQFSMDRFEVEGVDPYGNDSDAYDLANKELES